MSIDDTNEVAEVLRGYEHWRRAKAASVSDDMLSVSAYLDDYAKTRALDALDMVHAAWGLSYGEYEQFGLQVAAILGLPKRGDK